MTSLIIPFDKLPTGSQADWIQAMASVIAAVGLVITLLLQWKSAKDQNEALAIERKKYSREIMPFFEVVSKRQTSIDDFILIIMTLKLSNANAYSLVCKADGNPSIRFSPQTESILLKDRVLEVSSTHKRSVSGGFTINKTKGRILYSDIDGRRYQQDIYFNEGFREGPIQI